MVIFYSKSCEGCVGNHALSKMQAACERKGVDFQERRTVLWKVFKEEAEEIMRINEGLKLPFFYNTETGAVLHGNSLTPQDQIDLLIKKGENETKVEGGCRVL